MHQDLLGTLEARRSLIDRSGETWESQPATSHADASAKRCAGVNLELGDAPSAHEWLRQKADEVPEEDALGDALEELIRGRGSQPKHAPCLEFDIGTPLQLQDQETSTTETRLSYRKPDWLADIQGTINVAVVGNSGVGKSLLINTLRRVKPGSQHWAPVGVNETTLCPTAYNFPGSMHTRLWDLPGAGTPDFPESTYIQNMGLRYFDSVLIVTAGSFTTMEVSLQLELQQHLVPFFMVRTKVDMDVWNNKLDNDYSEEQTLSEIREELQRRGVYRPYLVSCREPDRFDLRCLLGDALPGLKRHLDALDFMFCPTARGDSLGSAWIVPSALSPILARIQGHWIDKLDWSSWIVEGSEVHVTRQDCQCGVFPLEEAGSSVWIFGHWFVDLQRANQARDSSVLQWLSAKQGGPPLVWHWAG